MGLGLLDEGAVIGGGQSMGGGAGGWAGGVGRCKG